MTYQIVFCKGIAASKNDPRAVQLETIIFTTFCSTEHFLHFLLTLLTKHHDWLAPLALIRQSELA